MKTVIRILTQVIWIRLPEKVWIVVQQQSDLNSSSTDSNPNSSKGYFDGLIRITIQVIRIPSEEEMKLRATDSNHPYSNLNSSWKTGEEIEAQVWITYIAIRIPHEKQGKAIWIFELWIRIPSQIEAKDWKSDRANQILEFWIWITLWRKIQILQRWFESPKQWFDSVPLQKH